jgi:hypothetical protein
MAQSKICTEEKTGTFSTIGDSCTSVHINVNGRIRAVATVPGMEGGGG